MEFLKNNSNQLLSSIADILKHDFAPLSIFSDSLILPKDTDLHVTRRNILEHFSKVNEFKKGLVTMTPQRKSDVAMDALLVIWKSIDVQNMTLAKLNELKRDKLNQVAVATFQNELLALAMYSWFAYNIFVEKRTATGSIPSTKADQTLLTVETVIESLRSIEHEISEEDVDFVKQDVLEKLDIKQVTPDVLKEQANRWKTACKTVAKCFSVPQTSSSASTTTTTTSAKQGGGGGVKRKAETQEVEKFGPVTKKALKDTPLKVLSEVIMLDEQEKKAEKCVMCKHGENIIDKERGWCGDCVSAFETITPPLSSSNSSQVQPDVRHEEQMKHADDVIQSGKASLNELNEMKEQIEEIKKADLEYEEISKRVDDKILTAVDVFNVKKAKVEQKTKLEEEIERRRELEGVEWWCDCNPKSPMTRGEVENGQCTQCGSEIQHWKLECRNCDTLVDPDAELGLCNRCKSLEEVEEAKLEKEAAKVPPV